MLHSGLDLNPQLTFTILRGTRSRGASMNIGSSRSLPIARICATASASVRGQALSHGHPRPA